MKKYPGQKKINGLFHKIINEIPVHKTYYELFAGSAAIYKELVLTVPQADTVKYILNDLNRSVTDKIICTGHTTDILNCNAFDILQQLLSVAADTDTFIFMDPPYLHSTRPNNIQLYKHEMTDTDHLQLLKSVLQLKCNIMIIHPKCELYDTMLSGWRKVLIKVRYNNKTSIECLYMNYEKPSTLQTYIYLGKDCWDRQRIKRKTERLIKKLSELPEQERKYVIQRINRQNPA